MTPRLHQILQKLQRPYLKAFDPTGRSSVGELFGYLITSGVMGILLGSIIGQFAGVASIEGMRFWIYWALALPSFALLCRRLHDLGYSALWSLLLLPAAAANFQKGHCFAFEAANQIASGACDQPAVAYIASIPGVLLAIVLLFAEGQRRPNRFGADPCLPVNPDPDQQAA